MAKSKSSSGVGGPGLMIAVLAVIGVYKAQGSLDPGHVAASETLTVALEGPERIAARLWADPVHAVHRTLAREGMTDAVAGVIDLDGLALASPLGTASQDPGPGTGLLVLTVLTHSGSAPEVEEKRRRTRYAVHAAFSIEGYQPVHSEYLGAFRFVRPGHVECGDKGDTLAIHGRARHVFPFEVLKLGAASAGSGETSSLPALVLVVWVPEDELGEETLGATHALLESVACSLRGQDNLRYAFIGPTSTSELTQLVKSDLEFEHEAQSCAGCPFVGSVLISTWATAASTTITKLKDLVASPCKDGGVVTSGVRVSRFPFGALDLPRSGLRIERGIETDDKLVDLLVGELRLRGVDVEGDPIALLGEFGSAYSNSFLTTFQFMAGQEGRAGAAPESPARVELYAYPLGLDGAVPGEADDGGGRSDPDEIPLELAMGTSQVDYVRRLQQQLGSDSFKAIGIVGTNVTDKLMLLRALRLEFPHAILFTINLDARFLDPSEYKFVRNLLIASHFGLRPDLVGAEQARPLPFRDGYQTANFWAVRDHLQSPSGAGKPRSARGAGRETGPRARLVRILTWLRQLNNELQAAEGGSKETRAEHSERCIAFACEHAVHSEARLWELGRTHFVDLSQGSDYLDASKFLGWAFPALGLLAIYLLVWSSERSQTTWRGRIRWLLFDWRGAALLDPQFRERVFQRLVSGFTPTLRLLFVACLGLSLLSAWQFWTADKADVELKLMALILTVSALLLAWWTLVHKAVGPGSQRPNVRIIEVSIPAVGFTFLVVGLIGLAWRVHDGPGRGEPLELLEGINVWPTIAIRLVVIVCSISAFIVLVRFLKREECTIARVFGLRSFGDPAVDPNPPLPSLDGVEPPPGLARAWMEYTSRSRSRASFSILCSVAFLGVLWFAHAADSTGFVHARGPLAIHFESWTRSLSLVGIALLIALLAHSTHLCRRLIMSFCDQPRSMYWEHVASSRAVARRLKTADLNPLRVLRHVARLTDRVSRLSWYPFALLFVLILAQNGYVENWAWSRASIALFGICIAGAIGSAVALRHSAECLREFLLAQLREDMLRHKLRNDRNKLDEIEQAIEEIEETHEGAFLPLREHPIVTAVLLPFGGATTIALLEVL